MTGKHRTLQQIRAKKREEKSQEYAKMLGFSMSSKNLPLNDKEQDDCFRKWLQQEPLKLNYLTEKETEMIEREVNLQIVLGLQSCKTKGDVFNLLNDIRTDERKRLLVDLNNDN